MVSHPGSDVDPVLDYIERFSSVLIAAGFPSMAARVFVALQVTESGQLSAAELADTLRISPAAVSGAVRYLMQIGMAHRVRVPGSRRDYYRVPGDVWHDLLRMRTAVMERWAGLLREGQDLLPAGSAGRARLDEQASFIDFVNKEIPAVIERWEEYRAGNG